MTNYLYALLVGLIMVGFGCVSSSSVSEPASEPQQKAIVYDTSLAERIGRLQLQNPGVIDAVIGRNGEVVTFTSSEDRHIMATFVYTLDIDPVVYFQETALLVSANTQFTLLKEKEQLVVNFRSTDPNKIARDATYLMEALWGEGFFDE